VAFNVLTAESLAAYQWGSNFQVCSALPVSAVPELQSEGSVAFHSLSATVSRAEACLRPSGTPGLSNSQNSIGLQSWRLELGSTRLCRENLDRTWARVTEFLLEMQIEA
jgi:hypothetical protein